MAIIAKESLENLKNRIDLVDVIDSYVDLKRTGASYKGLCPFHDEKSPSFVIQKGDSHYHCFGCGAHGDAIQFLMQHQSMGFVEAVEMLAEKYQVHLEHVEEDEPKGPSKQKVYEALEEASLFFRALLLHTENGHAGLQYLYERGMSIEFVQKFGIGYAPAHLGAFLPFMRAKKISDEILLAAGLVRRSSDGKLRDFFSDRLTFPIHNGQGRVIGFSARKFHEETYGGKYINSVETPVFKKSRTLYGLNYCRRRIAKERQAVIVEGQIDCLRLIDEGLDITVAGQGTAFGEGHVQELLSLGVNRIFLALDSDLAGREAAVKIGNLFQRAGVGVSVLKLPQNSDPDDFVKRNGIQAFLDLMDKAVDYLPFLVELHSHKHKASTPAEKNELVYTLASQIRGWNDEVMIHESLKLLAQLTQVPEEMVLNSIHSTPNVYVQGSGRVGEARVDPHLILESDFLRWLLLMGDKDPQLIALAEANIQPEDLKHAHCRQIYGLYIDAHREQSYCDWMLLAMKMEPAAQQLLSDLHQKRVNKDKAQEHFKSTIQRILDRNWMEKREAVRVKIQSGSCADDELFEHLKTFDALKSSPPQIKDINEI